MDVKNPVAHSLAAQAAKAASAGRVKDFFNLTNQTSAALAYNDIKHAAMEGKSFENIVDIAKNGGDLEGARITRAFRRNSKAKEFIKSVMDSFRVGVDGRSGLNRYKKMIQAYASKSRKFFKNRDNDAEDRVTMGLLQGASYSVTPDSEGEVRSFKDQNESFLKLLESSNEAYEAMKDSEDKQQRKRYKREENNHKAIQELIHQYQELMDKLERSLGSYYTNADANSIQHSAG